MIVMGIVIALTFLLAVLAGSDQARAEASAPMAAPAPAGDAQPVDATPLVYLALVGGTALLAGIAWLGTLRRVQQPVSDLDLANSVDHEMLPLDESPAAQTRTFRLEHQIVIY
jgi:hypothetical protein